MKLTIPLLLTTLLTLNLAKNTPTTTGNMQTQKRGCRAPGMGCSLSPVSKEKVGNASFSLTKESQIDLRLHAQKMNLEEVFGKEKSHFTKSESIDFSETTLPTQMVKELGLAESQVWSIDSAVYLAHKLQNGDYQLRVSITGKNKD